MYDATSNYCPITNVIKGKEKLIFIFIININNHPLIFFTLHC